MNDTLKNIYYDPKHVAGLSSIKKLSEASGINSKKVKEWLKAQPTYSLHKMARKNIQHDNTLYMILMSNGKPILQM